MTALSLLLSTLPEYEIEEISVEHATELLDKRLRANALAARAVALRNEQAASKVAYWASLFCRGYEVEEIEIDCIAT